jgi:uncharacterized protein YdaU (DUF1376 family)
VTQPWYPFFWSDYSGKTLHLSQGEHGAYMLLLRWIYTTEQPIPAKQCYGIARATTEQEQSNVDSVLRQFFTETTDGWVNDRALQVIRDANASHLRRVRAGKEGGKAKARRAKHRSSNATAMLEQSSSNQNQNQNQEDSDSSLRSESEAPAPLFPYQEKTAYEQRRAIRLDPDWKPDDEDREFADGLGVDHSEFDKFRDHFIAAPGQKGLKRDWKATLRNWLRRAAEDRGGSPGGAGSGRMGYRQGHGSLIAAARAVGARFKDER